MDDYMDLDQMTDTGKIEPDFVADMDQAYGFSKNANRDPDDHVPVMKQNAADDNVQAEEPMEDVARKADNTKNPSQEFRNWADELLRSEKGGLFGGRNSDRFERVHQALVDAVGAFMGSFGTDSARNIQMLAEAQTACNALLAACKQYTSRKPKTPAGKARRKMVLQIQALAAKDELGLGDAITDFCGLSPEEQLGQTWASVLGKARSVSLTEEDFYKRERASGGQVSQVFKVQGKYFKAEDSLNVDGGVGKTTDNANRYIALQETLELFPKLSQADREKLKEFAESEKTSGALSKKGEKALEHLKKRSNEMKVLVNQVLKPQGIVDEGGMANTTRRNVATSRMAELLGLGHLVAKSQTAEIHDQATGKIIRGNLMDQAEGVELNEVKAEISKKKEAAFTSGGIRDIMNLQVLDVLCGQVDRHAGNMLYKTNAAGQISGIQGIDNDASFGTNIDTASAIHQGRKDYRIFDPNNGEMVIPYMDKALADRIEKLDSSVVRYVLRDLLKEAEIEAAVQRLENMKAGIIRAKKVSPERFLENEAQWTPQVAQQMANIQKNRLEESQKTVYKLDFTLKVIKEYFHGQLADDLELYMTNVGAFNKKKYPAERVKEVEAAKAQLKLLLVRLDNAQNGSKQNYFGRYISGELRA